MKVFWTQDAVVKKRPDPKIGLRAERFDEIAGEGRPSEERHMLTAQRRVQTSGVRIRDSLEKEQRIGERKASVDGVGRWSAHPAPEGQRCRKGRDRALKVSPRRSALDAAQCLLRRRTGKCGQGAAGGREQFRRPSGLLRYTPTILKQTQECVINIQTEKLAAKVVGRRNTPGATSADSKSFSLRQARIT